MINAFPKPDLINDSHIYNNEQDGMTLRDYFAAKAMQGIIPLREHSGGDFGYESEDDIARRAYQMADAMMRVRG